MEYQEFLDIIGCTESCLDEGDYYVLVQPILEARRDLFSNSSAVAAHVERFGVQGFDEEFVEVLGKLTEAMREARREARIQMVPFEWLLTSAEELIP